MRQCEMLDVAIGFKKEHADWVREQLGQVEELVINPSDMIPKHIALLDNFDNVPKVFHYVMCRIETRSLMSAAVAGYVGEEVEIMRLFAIPASI